MWATLPRSFSMCTHLNLKFFQCWTFPCHYLESPQIIPLRHLIICLSLLFLRSKWRVGLTKATIVVIFVEYIVRHCLDFRGNKGQSIKWVWEYGTKFSLFWIFEIKMGTYLLLPHFWGDFRICINVCVTCYFFNN